MPDQCSFCYQDKDEHFTNSFCFAREYKIMNPKYNATDNSTAEFLKSELDDLSKCKALYNSDVFDPSVKGNYASKFDWHLTMQYCHAPFSWIAIVGMVIYLLFYAPGLMTSFIILSIF